LALQSNFLRPFVVVVAAFADFDEAPYLLATVAQASSLGESHEDDDDESEPESEEAEEAEDDDDDDDDRDGLCLLPHDLDDVARSPPLDSVSPVPVAKQPLVVAVVVRSFSLLSDSQFDSTMFMALLPIIFLCSPNGDGDDAATGTTTTLTVAVQAAVVVDVWVSTL
jgi:hypothetical protein